MNFVPELIGPNMLLAARASASQDYDSWEEIHSYVHVGHYAVILFIVEYPAPEIDGEQLFVERWILVTVEGEESSGTIKDWWKNAKA